MRQCLKPFEHTLGIVTLSPRQVDSKTTGVLQRSVTRQCLRPYERLGGNTAGLLKIPAKQQVHGNGQSRTNPPVGSTANALYYAQ